MPLSWGQYIKEPRTRISEFLQFSVSSRQKNWAFNLMGQALRMGQTYLFSPHSIKKCNNDPSSLLEYCILVSSHPPNSHIPSAVLSSVISGRNHVIPEIPAWQIQKYFSTSALVYWYIYIINMPVLFLNCRQRRERVLLCCQINTLQNIYKMGHPVCSPWRRTRD